VTAVADAYIGRFKALTTEEMTPEQHAATRLLLDGTRGSVPTPYRIWLSSPGLVAHLEGLGRYLLRESSLSPREAEIGILVTAFRCNCPFVLWAHTRAGRRVGLPDAVIDALVAGQPPELNDARERAVYDVARAVPEGAANDELYAHALAALGQQGVADLTGLIGYYTAVVSILSFHKVEPPAQA
jgi:4-carboxymuconolactone decarboxylase